MSRHDDATRRQVLAAAPDRSTWLSANAGSGKTRVLTDRVARLLLSGVGPQHILCLTYTKAAASEMQNRLFKRLGAWAMLDDAALRDELHMLGVEGPFADARLRDARTLFARAIEAPGGLKIQTIHSFCAALLRRFPLEARVSPQFTEIEDQDSRRLRNEIIAELADGPQADVLRRAARYNSGDSFEALTSEILRNRGGFDARIDAAALWAMFGLAPGYDDAALLSEVFTGEEADILAELLPLMRASDKVSDTRAAERLAGMTRFDVADLAVLEGLCLTGAGAKQPFCAKIGSFPTKALREGNPELTARLDALMQRIEAARAHRLALAAARRSAALHDLAQLFLPEYERQKERRGWLDFDDLILRARSLLSETSVAQWVLYRLDGGIDHILVDEAQDTSPTQWGVIALLAQEFYSGASARSDMARTIFVVGDKKQSIYSFQGADPEEFDRMQADFAARIDAAADHPLQSLELEYSFRSASAVLDTVDATFTGRETSGFGTGQRHRAFRADLPGRVDLWPAIEPAENPQDGAWDDPVDLRGQDHHMTRLAQRIAGQISEMVHTPAMLPADGSGAARAVQPGDFLILVQRRSELFHEVIRACKSAGLPVAGADRLKVGAEIAVRDLAALLSFLALPEDDLSLATVLKSPLVGWDEQRLFDLAHRRTQRHLWPALRDRGAEFAPVMAMLDDLRRQADFLRPYELLERALTRHDGRRRLLARLGAEAEDGIDALLSQALAYERTTVPSLTGFLVWMQTDELEIKRQMDSAGNRIRVMTVHGAKGLEAPIVILPDCAHRRPAARAQVIRHGDTALWATSADDAPDVLRAAFADAAEAEQAERDRLLYVAMTRAEQWLIVAAAGDLGKDGTCWYHRVEAGIQSCGGTAQAFPFGPGLRVENGDWGAAPAPAEGLDEATQSLPEVPHYYRTAAPQHPQPPRTLSPSDLGGAKALAGEAGLDEEAAKRRGRQIHRLLELLPGLPRGTWDTRAPGLLATGGDVANSADCALLLAEARAVLDAPDLALLFDRAALAEVSISANVASLGGRRVHGTIDRLILTPERVLAVDFKTNAIVPATPQACPDGLLRQMGAYQAALSVLYPDRRVETALLWTRTAELMHLPHDVVTAALADTQIS